MKTTPPVADNTRPAGPAFLFATLVAARLSGDRALESVARNWLAEVGVRVVFADELDAPTPRKGVARG